MSSPTDLILYVDDEKANRVVFEHSFGSRFHIETAAGAKDALEVLAARPVAVLVTDQRMPEVTGNELLVKVREDYPGVIRVVITAYSDFEPILQAVNEGLVARYVIKPWDRGELERLLDWAVQAYQLGQHDSALRLRLLQVERLATLGSIAAMAIHDLRSPLTDIQYNVQRLSDLSASVGALEVLLAEHADELTSSDRQRLTDLIAELPVLSQSLAASSKLLDGMTSSLRGLSRQGQGDSERARPRDAIRYTLSTCRRAVIGARGTLAYDGPEELPQVTLGSAALVQILINLVVNAAQALAGRDAPGGRVDVSARALDGAVEIEVSDNGVGIAPENLSRVGQLFFSTRKDGAGLGIAQCYRLIQEAGGSLTIESEPGTGTRVRCTIPRADAATEADAG